MTDPGHPCRTNGPTDDEPADGATIQPTDGHECFYGRYTSETIFWRYVC